jgi:hypothetical protein
MRLLLINDFRAIAGHFSQAIELHHHILTHWVRILSDTFKEISHSWVSGNSLNFSQLKFSVVLPIII